MLSIESFKLQFLWHSYWLLKWFLYHVGLWIQSFGCDLFQIYTKKCCSCQFEDMFVFRASGVLGEKWLTSPCGSKLSRVFSTVLTLKNQVTYMKSALLLPLLLWLDLFILCLSELLVPDANAWCLSLLLVLPGFQ